MLYCNCCGTVARVAFLWALERHVGGCVAHCWLVQQCYKPQLHMFLYKLKAPGGVAAQSQLGCAYAASVGM